MSWLICKVYKTTGIFNSERIAEFKIEETSYTLIVDEKDVDDDSSKNANENGVDGKLRVRLLEKAKGSYLLDLPRDSIHGQRIYVPENLIIKEEKAAS